MSTTAISLRPNRNRTTISETHAPLRRSENVNCRRKCIRIYNDILLLFLREPLLYSAVIDLTGKDESTAERTLPV